MKFFILNIFGLLICLVTIIFFEVRRDIYDYYRLEMLKRLFNKFNHMVSERYEIEFKENVENFSKLQRVEYNDLVNFCNNIEKMTIQHDELKNKIPDQNNDTDKSK